MHNLDFEYNGRTLTVARCLKDRVDTHEVTVSDGKIVVSVDSLAPIAIVENTGSQSGEDTSNPGAGVNPSFTDGKETDWFYEDVMFVYKKGLMTGTSATTFAPNGTAIRAQLAAMLHRFIERYETEPAAAPAGK